MPDSPRGRLLTVRALNLGRRFELTVIYLLIGLSLLAALTLAAFHPEDDPVVVIGVVLLTGAAAVWLPFLYLFPAVVLIWLIPPSIRHDFAGGPGWLEVAVLAGQLYLAAVTRLSYKSLSSRLLHGEESVLPPHRLTAASRPTLRSSLPGSEANLSPQPLIQGGPILGVADALYFLDRLVGLNRELNRSGEAVQLALEGCLGISEEYQRSGILNYP
jgi:hypothetical protein